MHGWTWVVAQFKEVRWELPPDSVCVAIRVQLRGIHTLHIHHFQAFQGDQLVPYDESDLDVTIQSFASLSPSTMRRGWKLMDPSQWPEDMRLARTKQKMKFGSPSAKLNKKQKKQQEVERLTQLVRVLCCGQCV